jgi:dTDP-4-dehydrorhamnose reductase
MKKILVTGANGQLGSELRQLATLFGQYQFLFTDSTELPVQEEDKVTGWFKKHQPQFCINCAAYTAVDKAEAEPAKAMLVNGDAVGYLAKACAANDCRLIQISTDYVFDGTATAPLNENVETNAVSRYGLSKQKGETLALAFAPGSIVIRTSWVYSAYGNNFVKTMLRLMAERPVLNVVNDQFGSPTYAADLANAIMCIITKIDGATQDKFGGIYHYANTGIISWYDFAVAINVLSGLHCQVNPIPSSAYPTPAKRPAYSGFDTKKISQTFSLSIPAWEDSLQHGLLQIQQWLAR